MERDLLRHPERIWRKGPNERAIFAMVANRLLDPERHENATMRKF